MKVVYAMFPGNMDHVIHVPREYDAALTKPGNVVYFCTSRDAHWTNHNRTIQVVIWQHNIAGKMSSCQLKDRSISISMHKMSSCQLKDRSISISMQQVLQYEHGLKLHRTRHFFPASGYNYQQSMHRGTGRLSWPGLGGWWMITDYVMMVSISSQL